MSGYSVDLRERIIRAWQSGKSQAWLVERFGVSLSSVQRYIARYRMTGGVEPTVQKRQAPRISAEYHAALRAMVRRMPQAQLPEYCAEWQRETGIVVRDKTMRRMLLRLGLRQKKTVGACERDEAARADWRERAATLPARRSVVVDESSTHIDMTRRYARAPRGQRAYASQQRNTGHNISLLATLRLDGMDASMVVEGGVNAAVFEAYVQHVLLPELNAGDIGVLDNLAVHKSARVRGLLAARGVSVLYLPTYSPDLSPIENAFAKLKAYLRRVRAQTVDALLDAIADGLRLISPFDAIAFFAHAGLLNLD